VNLFLLRDSIVLYDDSCLLGSLSEPSNDKNQLSTTGYALSRHDCFNVLTNIDLFAFTPTRTMLVFGTLGLV